MARPKKKQPKPVKVVLDWKAYFLEFCRLHGEPIEHKGLLLFRDGWRYSKFDYAGPEVPPPKDHDELDVLVVSYWMIRKGLCEKMLAKLLTDLNELKRQQNDHSLPLMQVVVVKEKDKPRRGAIQMDVSPLDERIRWVTLDVRECESRLKEIEDYHRNKSDVARTAG